MIRKMPSRQTIQRRRRHRPNKVVHRGPSDYELNPHIFDRMQRVFYAAEHGLPVDLGVTPHGTIRLLTHTFGSADPCDWFSVMLVSHDRSFKEWMALIGGLKASATSNNLSPPFDPFRDRAAAGACLERIFQRNMNLRWIIRKFVTRTRLRIMNRRHIGFDNDLYTILPVPIGAQVSVYDLPSRSKYTFHTQTAIKMILQSLQYSSYGIAGPMAPKNPYTNITWTYGQIMTIMEQIACNLMRSHKILPPLLYSYVDCKYDLDMFFQANRRMLHIDAACAFFRNVHDGDVLAIYAELMDRLCVSNTLVQRQSWRAIRGQILLRKLPADIQARWDRLILAVWIWDNHQMLYGGFRRVDDLETEFDTLLNMALTWWLAQPRTIARPAAPAPAPAPAEER